MIQLVAKLEDGVSVSASVKLEFQWVVIFRIFPVFSRRRFLSTEIST